MIFKECNFALMSVSRAGSISAIIIKPKIRYSNCFHCHVFKVDVKVKNRPKNICLVKITEIRIVVIYFAVKIMIIE